MLDVTHARSLLQQARPVHPQAGYPEAVRSAVVKLARTRLAEGHSVITLCRELDLNRTTLWRWLGEERETESSFVPMLIEASPESEASPLLEMEPTRLTLSSPTGFRLEGLSLDAAIHVLRQLS